MGLGNMAANAAIDAVAKQQEMKRMMRGRTPEQQSVIKYFYQAGGCLSKKLTDAEYEAMLQRKLSSMNFKQRALDKIGLDESQVAEIEPVHFEGYDYDDKDAMVLRGRDNFWRSSKYQVSWLFFSADQIYVYQYTLDMATDAKKERTEEYFYKDVTNFSSSSDSVEKETVDKISCTGKATYTRSNVDYSRFALVVPGEKFYCSMQQTEYTEASIQGMKAKLREKKL